MYKQSSLILICKILAWVGGFGLLVRIMRWPFGTELTCIGFIGGGISFTILMILNNRNKKK